MNIVSVLTEPYLSVLYLVNTENNKIKNTSEATWSNMNSLDREWLGSDGTELAFLEDLLATLKI